MIAARNFYRLTPEEYFEWESRQDVRHEYFDGETFAMAGGTLPHSTISVNVTTALKSRLRGRGCLVLNSDAKVGISAKGPFTYPDVSVTCDDRDRTAKDFAQYPTVIVEVLSPSTEAYDRGGKFALYRQVESLQDYVLVSAETRLVEVFHRNDRGRWELSVYEESGDVVLEGLDVILTIEEIYEDVTFEAITIESP